MKWKTTGSVVGDAGRFALAVGDLMPIRSGIPPKVKSELDWSQVPKQICGEGRACEVLLTLAHAGINERWLGDCLSKIQRVREVSEHAGRKWHLPRGMNLRELKMLPTKTKWLAEYIDRVNRQRPELYGLADPYREPSGRFIELPERLREYALYLDCGIKELMKMRRGSGQGTRLDSYLRNALVEIIAGTIAATGKPHYAELAELLGLVVPETCLGAANLGRFGQRHQREVKTKVERFAFFKSNSAK